MLPAVLPAVLREFDLVCIFTLFFSFHYHSQLAKGQLYQKRGEGGISTPALPRFLRAWIQTSKMKASAKIINGENK